MIKKKSIFILTILSIFSLITVGFSTFYISTTSFKTLNISSVIVNDTDNVLNFDTSKGNNGITGFEYVNGTYNGESITGFVLDGAIGNQGKVTFYMILDIKNLVNSYQDISSTISFNINTTSSIDFINNTTISSLNVTNNKQTYYLPSVVGVIPSLSGTLNTINEGIMNTTISIQNLNLNAETLYFSFNFVFTFNDIGTLISNITNNIDNFSLDFEVIYNA